MGKTDSAESAEGPGRNPAGRAAGPLLSSHAGHVPPGTPQPGAGPWGLCRPISAPGFFTFGPGQQLRPLPHSGPWGKLSQRLARLVLGKYNRQKEEAGGWAGRSGVEARNSSPSVTSGEPPAPSRLPGLSFLLCSSAHPAWVLPRLNEVTDCKALSTVSYKWHFKKWHHYFHYRWSWASKRVGGK